MYVSTLRRTIYLSRNVCRVGLARVQEIIEDPISIELLDGQFSDQENIFREQACYEVENTLKMLKEDLQTQQDEETQKLKLVPAKHLPVKKLTIKEKIVHELKHYYHGFRLLALETRLSSKYMWRIIRGSSLTRRERQQLVRTTSDLFRLVPFSFFIIVPFMEFALPFVIKLFPGMLPSTFQESSKEEEKVRKQLKVKVEMAKFLQDTIEEIALERNTTTKDSKAFEFSQFIKKVRHEGGYVSNEELLKFAKLFEDELTLDNLSMSQLRSLCKLMGVQSFGSPEILRFQLKMKLRELKADDKQIAAEGGVDCLSTLDLQHASRARGMRALGLSEERLKDQLKQWLELSLNDKVPPSLLLLSRTLYLPEDISFADRLKALVQNLPDNVSEHTRQRLTEMEGGKVDHRARLALVRHIEDAIAKEKQLALDKKKEQGKLKELQREAEEARVKAEAKVAAIPTMEPPPPPKTPPPPAPTPEAIAVAKTISEKTGSERIGHAAANAQMAIDDVMQDVDAQKSAKDDKVTSEDLVSIEQIIVGGPIHEAKHDISGLKEKVIERTEDLLEINALDGAFTESKVAQRLRSKLNALIGNVDTLVDRLEEEKRKVDELLVDPAVPGSAGAKKEKQVRIQDLINELGKLKSGHSDRTGRITQLLKKIDEDEDGIIDRDLVLEVIALMEKHGDLDLSPSEMASLVGLLKKEDEAEAASLIKDSVFEAPITPQITENVTSVIKEPKEASKSVLKVDPEVTQLLRQAQQKKAERKDEIPPS